MAIEVQEWSREDPEAVPAWIRKRLEQQLGERVRCKWLGDKVINQRGMRRWTPFLCEPGDPNYGSPDSRYRNSDRFLAYMPESMAQQKDAMLKRKMAVRLAAVKAGANLGSGVTDLVRKGLIKPKLSADGWDGRGYLAHVNAGMADPSNEPTKQMRNRDSQPTPREHADHLDQLRSQADLPDVSVTTPEMQEHINEAAERWVKSKRSVFGIANKDSLALKRGED